MNRANEDRSSALDLQRAHAYLVYAILCLLSSVGVGQPLKMGQNVRVRPKRVSKAELNKWVRNLPQGYHQARTYYLSLIILKRFLGEEWVEKNVRQTESDTGFFSENKGPATDPIMLLDHLTTINKLADMILNLQYTTNFDAALSQLLQSKGTQLETTFAELETAMLLYRCRVPFRFIEPIQKRGHDYDFEIILSGNTIIAAETKCKVTDLICSENSVYNVLHDNIGQVPSSIPSFFFLKIPKGWMDEPNHTMVMAGIRRFLNGTGRVASVKIHVEERLLPSISRSEVTYSVLEITNTRCRFLRKEGWDIFLGGRNMREWQYLARLAGASGIERRFE